MPRLEWHDPPDQKFCRINPLTAEVVNQQTTTVALKLNRSFANIRAWIVADFQVVHRQLAANDDRRSPNLHPPRIHVRRFDQAFLSVVDRFVASCIVELDELSIFCDCTRKPNMLAETVSNPLRQRRFAITRRSVQK